MINSESAVPKLRIVEVGGRWTMMAQFLRHQLSDRFGNLEIQTLRIDDFRHHQESSDSETAKNTTLWVNPTAANELLIESLAHPKRLENHWVAQAELEPKEAFFWFGIGVEQVLRQPEDLSVCWKTLF